MKKQGMTVNQVAKLTGITVRTLHYYDEIGLLKPDMVTEAGYRMYHNENIELLQQILFLKELDFSLNDIKKMIHNSEYRKEQALSKHKELLIKKKERLEKLIQLVDDTMKGEKNMSFKEFDLKEIEDMKEKYAKEVKERWGDTDAYAENEKKTSEYNKEQWEDITKKGNKILEEFGMLRGTPPESEISKELVERWKQHITDSYYTCTNEILCGLGQMYVSDERFKENINQYGEGTAEFMAKAIEIYCKEIV